MIIAKRHIPLFPLLLTLLTLSGNFLGCETEDWVLSVDCNECYGYVPDSANLIIYLTINQENPSVPITVYKGSLEEGNIEWRDTARTDEFYLFSALDVASTRAPHSFASCSDASETPPPMPWISTLSAGPTRPCVITMRHAVR